MCPAVQGRVPIGYVLMALLPGEGGDGMDWKEFLRALFDALIKLFS
jgi:hypothetical protein